MEERAVDARDPATREVGGSNGEDGIPGPPHARPATKIAPKNGTEVKAGTGHQQNGKAIAAPDGTQHSMMASIIAFLGWNHRSRQDIMAGLVAIATITAAGVVAVVIMQGLVSYFSGSAVDGVDATSEAWQQQNQNADRGTLAWAFGWGAGAGQPAFQVLAK